MDEQLNKNKKIKSRQVISDNKYIKSYKLAVQNEEMQRTKKNIKGKREP